MPYTRTVTDYLTSLESDMPQYCVTDPTINASYGPVPAINADAARDYYATMMGWLNYADYVNAASKHSGTRTLIAVEMAVAS